MCTNRSIYAEMEDEGKRVYADELSPGCTPFLFDWDKAARDAGIRPLTPEELCSDVDAYVDLMKSGEYPKESMRCGTEEIDPVHVLESFSETV